MNCEREILRVGIVCNQNLFRSPAATTMARWTLIELAREFSNLSTNIDFFSAGLTFPAYMERPSQVLPTILSRLGYPYDENESRPPHRLTNDEILRADYLLTFTEWQKDILAKRVRELNGQTRVVTLAEAAGRVSNGDGEIPDPNDLIITRRTDLGRTISILRTLSNCLENGEIPLLRELCAGIVARRNRRYQLGEFVSNTVYLYIAREIEGYVRPAVENLIHQSLPS